MSKRVSILLVGLVFFSVFSSLVSAQSSEFNHIIANSENWRDVYSILHYADLIGVPKDFLVSPRHGPTLLNGINKNDDLRIITSDRLPFVVNYAGLARGRGFENIDEVSLNNPNLDLIDNLPEITNFIVVGNTYGYDAIAVAPYSVITNSWVFFADRANVDDIDNILSNRDVDSLMIYGYVDRDVRDTLAKYNPEIIDEGDRFENDIAIVEKYLKIKPTKQVLLTNGEFIENELMSGVNPILFTGKETVPDQIKNYIKSSDIEVGVLVGADLVGSATNIRRDTGISVIVKFARGARNPESAIAPVEGLDLFYLPVPIMSLDLYSAKYNRATSQLELTYKSDSNIPIFFKGTITPQGQGTDATRIGDVDAIFIGPNDYKTISYSDLDLTGEDLSVNIFTLYGESPSSLERILEKTLNVDTIDVLDRCKIEISGVKYSKPKEIFMINLENNGETDCYSDVELLNVVIDGTPQTLGSDGSVLIKAGKNKNIVIDQIMADDDLDENQFVDVVAYYGEREDSLVNTIQGRFELKIETISFATIALISLLLIVILAIIILLIILRRRKDEDDW